MDGIAVIFGALAVAAAACVYFVPAYVARVRDHPNKSGVLWLNVLAGWSLLGWVAALVWALSSIDKPRGASTGGLPRIDERSCPRCEEIVRRSASVCKFCGFEFTSQKTSPRGVEIAPARTPIRSDIYRGVKYIQFSDYSVSATVDGEEQNWTSGMAFFTAIDEAADKRSPGT